MKKITVKIHFINQHQGGWRSLPADIQQYTCTATFPDLDDFAIAQHWSVVVHIDKYNYETGEIYGSAHFLADHLPDELTIPMRRFELYEGPRFVGHGIVINDETK